MPLRILVVGEGVGGIEDRRVRVGECGAVAQEGDVHDAALAYGARALEQLHGRVRPHRPLSQQPTDDATR